MEIVFPFSGLKKSCWAFTGRQRNDIITVRDRNSWVLDIAT
jgi:hypothetical protein